MNVTLEWLWVATLTVLACGCGSGVEVSWSADNSSGSRNNGVSITRSNDELTVKVGDGPVVAGSGNVTNEKRSVAAFNKLAAQHGIQVQVEEGNGDSLTVEADDNLLPLVETKLENETLHVHLNGSLKTRNAIRVKAFTRQLSHVSVESSAFITASQANGARVHIRADSSGRVVINEARSDRIELAATSNGDVTAKNVRCAKLHVIADSSGRVAALGKVDEQQVEVSSSGNYNGSELSSRLAQVNCDSAGRVVVQATQELTGSASSAGSVRYSGNPSKVSVSTDSAGSVAKAD